LRRVLRRGDLLARLGGDECVAALRGVSDLSVAIAVAEEVRQTLQKPFYLNEMECWISSSIGIALFPDDAAEADGLVRCADAAMYQAKAAGKNQVRSYEPSLEDAISERFRIVNGIREAIHSGQLMLMFQPQIDVERECLSGAETLVRWRHPIRGIVSPSEFIPIAEESGLILPIGEWVMRTACAAAAAWSQVPGLRVAINVSGRQLERTDFPGRVERILEETGLPPSRLEIEITESAAASDHAVRVLTGMRASGIRTAIDDFGTGYSSLTLLRRLRVDTLKIDRSFVHDAGRDERPVILEGMIRIAQGLGIEVVAEGVETLSELSMLRSLGCTKMQGYLFSKPIPKQDFESDVAPADASWRIPLENPESWGLEDVPALFDPSASAVSKRRRFSE
jgi:predicted signal transduction protein with EAL and GGDEF domain